MWKRNWAWIAGAAAVVVAGASATPPGDTVVGQIDEESYQYILDELLFTHLGDSRGIGGAQHHPARDNIRDELLSYGFECHFETFVYQGVTGYNVVAELPGTTRPDEIYIIGGHYDSDDNPGADDDASGVAGMLEIARVLSQYESEATIRFMAFDMEEKGLIGSDDYATAHSFEDIRGMISLDMIAYDPGDAGRAMLYGRSASNPIKQAMASALVEYGSITSSIEGSLDASDHAPFEWQGFQACLLIENDVWSNPYYHRWNDSVDTPGYINYAYATEMTRGVAGWLTDAAGVLAVCAIDLNGDGFVDTQDFLAYLNYWSAGDPVADWDGDGTVNTLDFLGYLNDWAAGC
jgi:hypothetical protein